VPAVDCDKIVNGKEIHSIGTATKNECLNALMVDLKQGVVTTNSLVEPSATGIKVFDRRKYTLIA